MRGAATVRKLPDRAVDWPHLVVIGIEEVVVAAYESAEAGNDLRVVVDDEIGPDLNAPRDQPGLEVLDGLLVHAGYDVVELVATDLGRPNAHTGPDIDLVTIGHELFEDVSRARAQRVVHGQYRVVDVEEYVH